MALLIWKYESLTVAKCLPCTRHWSKPRTDTLTPLPFGQPSHSPTHGGRPWLREPQSPVQVSKRWIQNLNPRTHDLDHALCVSRSKTQRKLNYKFTKLHYGMAPFCLMSVLSVCMDVLVVCCA